MSGYARLGPTGLTVARVGFGGYRVDDATPAHRAALSRALRSGINLIDTSTNYTDGRSERLVGSVIRELVDAGAVRRDEVVVVSKVGYVQGRTLERARERESAGDPFPEMVKYRDGLWHCLHPDFIRDQLERSLERLELESVDVYLLHNPEYFLMDAADRGVDPQEARAAFYRRLQAAFAALNAEAEAGRIGAYGVSSNTVAAPGSDPSATSLDRMLETARAAAGDDHRFAALQLPLNLLEPDAALAPRAGPAGDRTILERAREAGLAVLANRPLNAFVGNRLIRLVDYELEPARKRTPSLEDSLDRLEEAERGFRERIAPALQAPAEALQPRNYFRWAEQLRSVLPRLRGRPDWSAIEAQVVYSVQVVRQGLDRNLSGDTGSRWAAWRDRYLDRLETALHAIRRIATERSHRQSRAVREIIDPRLPESHRDERLSRVALWVVARTPGVTAVLNGMRRPDYIDDGVAPLRWPPLDDPLAVYRALHDAHPAA